jgi:hypothetical protein
MNTPLEKNVPPKMGRSPTPEPRFYVVGEEQPRMRMPKAKHDTWDGREHLNEQTNDARTLFGASSLKKSARDRTAMMRAISDVTAVSVDECPAPYTFLSGFASGRCRRRAPNLSKYATVDDLPDVSPKTTTAATHLLSRTAGCDRQPIADAAPAGDALRSAEGALKVAP